MQEGLFYGFSLERHVPDDHLLRNIDRFVDLSEVRADLGPYYSDMGRPSIHPELMMRMLIVGYGFGIRSERRLCEEAHLNLAYRWFYRFGLDGDVRDHSTFSKKPPRPLPQRTVRSRYRTLSATATPACSNPSAVRICAHARSRDPFMKPLVTGPVRSPKPRPTPNHVANEKRSRCLSLI